MKKICLDFDGVLHSYSSGWKGAGNVIDPPVNGALTAIRQYIDSGQIEVNIYSSRSDDEAGIEAMKSFFVRHGLEPEYFNKLKFPSFKPPAFYSLDDRAERFDGTFPSVEHILEYKTWQQEDELNELLILRYPVLTLFSYAHLPPHLRAVSKPFCQLAFKMAKELPKNRRVELALDDLLEAKNKAVQSLLMPQ